MSSPHSIEILRGAITAARAANLELVLLDTAEQTDAVWLERITRAERTAVIAIKSRLTADDTERLRDHGIAVIEVDPYSAADGDAYSVGATNFAGAMAATQHLVDLGHERIGFLGGVADTEASLARKHGYLAALAVAGIQPDDDIVMTGEYTYESGVESATRLLQSEDPPSAIFAASDPQAAGVLEAARLEGIAVPKQLSVVGFDDQLVSRMTAPRLTTIRQPSEEMGRYAVTMAHQLLLGSPPPVMHADLATTLIERDSTAPPNPVRKRRPL